MSAERLARARAIHSPAAILAQAAHLAEMQVSQFTAQSGGGAPGSDQRATCDLKFAAVWLCYVMQHDEAEIVRAFQYRAPQGARYARDIGQQRRGQAGQIGEQYRRQLSRLLRALEVVAAQAQADRLPPKRPARPVANGMEVL